jgi:putative thioredoxin
MTFQLHDHQHEHAVGDKFIFDTDLHHFEADVIEASKDHLVIVDLWADWCGPCRFLTPVLEKVVPSYKGRVRMAKIEVDEGANMKIAGRYGARGFPTVLLFKNGVEAARFHSSKPEHFVREFIEAHLD